MALTYTYADAYLKSVVTEDREDRAMADVAAVATFAAEWVQKLTIIRAYILTCLECQAQPDDLFSQKLKHYRQEWESALASAKAATVDEDLNPMPTISISLERA
jgi:hypothetical protein